MSQADDVKPYPLGAPVRSERADEPERWEPVDPANPYVQRSSKTGLMRNVRPPPVEQFPPWGIVGMP